MNVGTHTPGTLEAKLDGWLNMPTPTGFVMAEYVWIGGSGADLRSKTRTLQSSKPITDVKDLPVWNYDGSSTGQAMGEDSEVYMYPRRIFKDPFRGGDNILVMCDCYDPKTGLPLPSNTRAAAADIFKKVHAQVPWFGIEQEYTMFDLDGWPLGWPKGGFPKPQGPYYCGAGADKMAGRAVADAHYKLCLAAGINISGVNAEVMPGQWEYQVGPCVGIDAGDQLWMSRYIMDRVCEVAGVVCSLDPKPIAGDWNGTGAHTNFSTEAMRAENGFEVIKKAIYKLGAKHAEHIAWYGEGNERRLTGKHETASIFNFSWGVAHRGASVRVGRDTAKENKGYFEDRRPAANMDPYKVTSKIADTTLLWDGPAPEIPEKQWKAAANGVSAGH